MLSIDPIFPKSGYSYTPYHPCIYGIYISHKNPPNVGKYTIHGCLGIRYTHIILNYKGTLLVVRGRSRNPSNHVPFRSVRSFPMSLRCGRCDAQGTLRATTSSVTRVVALAFGVFCWQAYSANGQPLNFL